MDNKDTSSLIRSTLIDSSMAPSANVEFIKANIPVVAITLQKPVSVTKNGKTLSYVEGDRALIRADGTYNFASKSEYEKFTDKIQLKPIRTQQIVENDINTRSNPNSTIEERNKAGFFCNVDSHIASNFKRELNKQCIPYSIVSLQGSDNEKNIIQIKVPEKFKEVAENLFNAIKRDIALDPQNKYYNEEVIANNSFYKVLGVDARPFFARHFLDKMTDVEKDPQNLETKNREMRRDAVKKEIDNSISACINYCTTIIGMIEQHRQYERSFDTTKSNLANTIKKTEQRLVDEFKKEPDAPLYFQIRDLQMLKAMEKAAESIDNKTPPTKLKERLEKFQSESYYTLLAQSLTRIRESLGYQEAQHLSGLSQTLPGEKQYGPQTKVAKPYAVDVRNTSDGLSQTAAGDKSEDTNQFTSDDIFNAPYEPKTFAQLLNEYEVPEQETPERVRGDRPQNNKPNN